MKDKTTSKREFRFDIKAGILVIVNENNETLRSFDVMKLNQETRDFCLRHGLKQKMTDDTMISKIGEDGDRLLACDDLWTRLLAGQWEKEREGLARPPEAIILFVMERKELDREVAVASLKQIGKDGWDGIKAKFPQDIQAIEARIAKAKAAASGVDLTDL